LTLAHHFQFFRAKGAAVQELNQHTGNIGQAIGTALLIKR